MDQFDLEFNRPDKVLERLGSTDQATIEAYQASYEHRFTALPEASERQSASVPSLRVKSAIPIYTTHKKVRVTVEATDEKTELATLQVYDNGVPIFGMHGITIPSAHTYSYSTVISLLLTAGTNHLQFSAINKSRAESLRQAFDVTVDTSPSQGHVIVIAVGVTHYFDRSQSLQYPAKDAADFAHFLSATWPRELTQSPRVLVEEGANRAAILALKKTVLAATSPEDTVLMLIAGHGVLDEGLNYYFAPYDMNFHQYHKAGLSLSDIEYLFDGIPARRKVVLIDTCHSGQLEFANLPAILPSSGGVAVIRPSSIAQQRRRALLEQAFIDLRRNSGVIVIGASAGAQTAVESGGYQNGAFTYTVLEALGRNEQKAILADTNHDGVVTVSELRDYVGRRVSALTNGQQTPLLWSGPDEYDFTIIQKTQ